MIPGGITALVQCGDSGVYKSFKDLLSKSINDCKSSDKCERTRLGNPKMPSENVPSHWVYQAWQSIPQSVIDKSISNAGFDDEVKNWHISRHDRYGHEFLDGWDAGCNVFPGRSRY